MSLLNLNLQFRYAELTSSLAKVLDDYSLVKFFPLDITNEENVQVVVPLDLIFLNAAAVVGTVKS